MHNAALFNCEQCYERIPLVLLKTWLTCISSAVVRLLSFFRASGILISFCRMNMAAMMGAKNGTPLIVIGKMAQPHYSVIIDNDNKEYSLNVIDTSLINMVHQKYQVSKIGNETVNGFNCIHAKLISTTGTGMFKSTSTEDIWTSADVPGYALFKIATVQQNITPGMMKALNDAGCGGFFVKMTSGDKHYTMTMQLTKAEKETFPASLFKIPAGYKESNENMMYHMMRSAQK